MLATVDAALLTLHVSPDHLASPGSDVPVVESSLAVDPADPKRARRREALQRPLGNGVGRRRRDVRQACSRQRSDAVQPHAEDREDAEAR
jgi:hypothetical protein